MGQGNSNAEGIMDIFRNVEQVISETVGGDSKDGYRVGQSQFGRRHRGAGREIRD